VTVTRLVMLPQGWLRENSGDRPRYPIVPDPAWEAPSRPPEACPSATGTPRTARVGRAGWRRRPDEPSMVPLTLNCWTRWDCATEWTRATPTVGESW